MTSAKGTSINGVGNWEDGKGLKIGQNCQRIVLKNYRHEGGGWKKSEKLPISFMDGPEGDPDPECDPLAKVI